MCIEMLCNIVLITFCTGHHSAPISCSPKADKASRNRHNIWCDDCLILAYASNVHRNAVQRCFEDFSVGQAIDADSWPVAKAMKTIIHSSFMPFDRTYAVQAMTTPSVAMVAQFFWALCVGQMSVLNCDQRRKLKTTPDTVFWICRSGILVASNRHRKKLW